MSVVLLKKMFDQMVVAKNPEAIARFYAPGFVMESNGVRQSYDAFARSHEGVYASDISYSVEYDEAAWVENAGRVAGRVWITTKLPNGPATRMEVILIAVFEEGRITRVWETTWPNWSDLKEFDDYS